MAESLLNQALAPDFAPEPFIQWLTSPELQGAQSTAYSCSRTDFITFFLNYVHEEIGSAISERKPEPLDTSKSSTELGPHDLNTSVCNSTPKGGSDSSVLSYMSPISPICLGDFFVNKRAPPRKTKKRIKPTNLTLNSSSFHKSDNSFNFTSESEEFPSGRSFLLEERLKVDFRSPKTVIPGGEVLPELGLVTNRPQIDRIVQLYSLLIADNCVLNLTREIYFLITLLLKKQFYNNDWGINVLSDTITGFLFNSIHNVVYFASKSLENLVGVLRNFDNSTVRLLTENKRLREFAPTLIAQLEQTVKPDRVLISLENLQNNICFNSDTDNRNNFPNDLSFHAFKKQRDLFYDILRVWEQHHLAPGFSYTVSLGGKIKTLLSLSLEPTNFVHFARLFKGQLLTCRVCDDLIITSLDVDAQKLNKLKNRCVTKESNQGLNSLPKFSESEEFFRDFIVVGANFAFNRHLADAFVEEIVELNESYFGNAEEDENSVDLVTKKSYFSCVKSLRILAKFLGFVESLPYKSECGNYSEQLLTTHLKIRKQICPTFDVKTLLENSIRRKSVILCVPWLIKYLSMLDTVTLKLPYYTQIQNTLYWIYRNFNWGPSPNIYLIKFCLGWLFELPHIPDNNALYFTTEETTQNSTESPKTSYIDQLEIVDQDILYFCCPYLNEIKKLLTTTTTNQMITIKHITPVTAQQSPDEIARKKLEQQLEEAFFNGQPISLRKSVEFVSERVASTCVKYVCSVLVPEFKKKSLETFKSMISTIDDETVLKQKANQFATDCLNELQVACEREIKKITQNKIRNGIESLLAMDVLPQTRDVCVGITEKMCLERVRQWLEAHVTSVIFSKDFNDEVQKLTNQETKRTKPLFVLPPGGSKRQHNDRTISGAHLVTKFQSLTIDIIEGKNVHNQLISLLDATSDSINERGDFNQCVVATLCTQILDVVILLHGVLSKSCDIWRLYYRDDLFKSLLSPRNVIILGRSKAAWDAFAQFCALLLKQKLLTCDSFEAQCTGIFRTDWDQVTLKVISDFFKRFHTLYREQGGSVSDFTFLLDFFSDYCEDLV
ncbi:codanin-1 isoform X2 [Tribolium castaneum]|uniref:codanin-1 isoform X2 n=1 Tax=Tribolium castaneum TaxID=7070 RepID=UPI00046BF188|nr:PREDICTED: codanin-1 isoform X2 [Tribolium castaneum]|eukprot:XP_008194510.1 PREDICTED: codanin-1 isoform X2 [Tribolium castaneum]